MAGDEAAQAGLQYEGRVWRHVLQRLDRRSTRRPGDPAYAGSRLATKDRPDDDPSDPELDDLRSIVTLRRIMAERLASFSETYRDEVWRNIQTKIDTQDKAKRGRFGLLRPPAAEAPRADSERRTLEEPSGTDAGPGDMLTVVAAREHTQRRASGFAEEHRQAVWRRIRRDIAEHDLEGWSGDKNRFARRFVLALAAAALVLAALGPMPVTGFAHHPAAEAIRFAGQKLGIAEVDSPPGPTVPDESVVPVDVTTAEAAEMLGFTVTAPDNVPGFTPTSSQVFAVAITADDGGMFVRTFEADDATGSLAIYQESASVADLAVGPASATTLTLSDGTEGFYVEGSWDMSAAAPAWDAAGTQTVVFERAGVRTIVRYSGPALDRGDLISIAELI